MDDCQIEQIVSEINSYIQKELWFDFEINRYQNYSLSITGGLSLSYPPNIEICFEQVFFLLLPSEWRTDTSQRVLSVLAGEEAKRLNIKFSVEQGHHIFRFSPEEYKNEYGCIVVAKAISYQIFKEANT